MRLATSVYSLLTLTTTTKNQTLFLKVYSATSLKVQNRSNWFGSWLYLHIVHKIIGGNYGLKLDFDFWCHPGNKSISRKVQHVKTHHSNLAHLLSQYLGKSLCNTSETFMTLKTFYTLLLNQTLYNEQATVFANSF